ncbi:OsmC family protein [Dyella choica]|uniref:OsmC family peroxiredoxin n=1 Tax=Dyella choica TaxID=1927959 RepID=A0A432MBH2_9GAMM|nr:OsmC family protein [Dyella choica]RUL78980.1 OsmC family peroxiredoxin [Dyella choica]
MTRVAKASIVSTGTNYKHHIRTGPFELVTDEPVTRGGQGEGPAPYDYYLAALASCTAITLRMYAEKKGWELGEFRADLSLSRDESGRMRIHRLLYSDQSLSDDQWRRLLEIVANTPVTRTMREGVEITSARGNSVNEPSRQDA